MRTPYHTVLVDTCFGNDKTRSDARWNKLGTPWLSGLRALGVEPESVDFVLCTHLHPDHIGWNTHLSDGRWAPTFPNARYLFEKHKYRKMLLSGEATSIEELARRFGMDRGHVGLTLNLAFLSPTLTRAIVRGEQPPRLRLNRLLRDGVPLSWREQEAAFLPRMAAREKQGM